MTAPARPAASAEPIPPDCACGGNCVLVLLFVLFVNMYIIIYTYIYIYIYIHMYILERE